MRRTCLAIAAAVTLLYASTTLAESNNLKDYYSTKHPKETTTKVTSAATTTTTTTGAAPSVTAAQKALPMKASLSPTNITLINATSDILYAVVPGSQVYDGLLPRSNMHIYNDYLYADTRLVLKDPYAATFYNDYVCRRAIITVYGQPGYYSLLIDREFC